MKLNLSVIKKHPVGSTAVIVGGGLVFYFAFLRGGSGDSGGNGLGYGDSQVAAASSISAAQAQMASRAQEIQGQIAMATIGAQNQLAVAQTQAEMQKALGAMSLAATQAGYARDIENIHSQEHVALEQTASQERVQTMGMEYSAQIQALTIQSQLAGLQSQLNRDVAMQKMMTDAQVALGQLSAGVQLAGISAQEAISHHTLDATTQQIKYQSELQVALGQQNVDMAEINANMQLQIAQTQASAAKHSSDNNLLGGIIGGIIGLF